LLIGGVAAWPLAKGALMPTLDSHLDVYVDSAPSFLQARGYILRRALDALVSAGMRCRVLDRVDREVSGRIAIVHVDLTEVPETLMPLPNLYELCLNGEAKSIHRHLYSRARIDRKSAYGGPVIVKTVLNHRGLPELINRCRSDSQMLWRWHFDRGQLMREHCPEYVIYPSKEFVPKAVWGDQRLLVERFVPNSMSLPVTKYRYDFFLDVTRHLREVYDSLLSDNTTVREVSVAGDIPQAVREVRRDLRLDFGSIDYFVVDDEAIVVDVNKTTACTEDWVSRYPAVSKYLRDVGARLVEVVRNGSANDIARMIG
jgi:hypothetical protein